MVAGGSGSELPNQEPQPDELDEADLALGFEFQPELLPVKLEGVEVLRGIIQPMV